MKEKKTQTPKKNLQIEKKMEENVTKNSYDSLLASFVVGKTHQELVKKRKMEQEGREDEVEAQLKKQRKNEWKGATFGEDLQYEEIPEEEKEKEKWEEEEEMGDEEKEKLEEKEEMGGEEKEIGNGGKDENDLVKPKRKETELVIEQNELEGQDEDPGQEKELEEMTEHEKNELRDEKEDTENPFIRHLSKEYTEQEISTWKKPSFVTAKWSPFGEVLTTTPLPPQKSMEELKPHLKRRVYEQWQNSSFKGLEKISFESHVKQILHLDFNSLQASLFSLMNYYYDILYAQRTFDDAERIRVAYLLHCINHITQ